VTVSRRTLLGLAGLAGAASVVAGCSRSRSAPGSASTHPPSSLRTATSAAAPITASAATAPPKSSTHAAVTIADVVAHVPRTRPEVALTFHGAGDPAIARELLAIFAAHEAKVTVLAVGTWLAENPSLGRQIIAAGHELGNHTYRHLDINTLSPQAARAEIVRCRAALEAAVGSGGALFRQSQARTPTRLVRRLAAAAGYPVCLSYDVDSLDYTDPAAAIVRARVAAARPGSVVSMHFGHAVTAEAMPAILGDLAGRELHPVTASYLLRP